MTAMTKDAANINLIICIKLLSLAIIVLHITFPSKSPLDSDGDPPRGRQKMKVERKMKLPPHKLSQFE